MKSQISQLADPKSFWIFFWPKPEDDFEQRCAKALIDAYPFLDHDKADDGKITEIRLSLFERMFGAG